MIKFILQLAVLLLSAVAFASNTPATLASDTEGDLLTRIFYSKNDWSALAEIQAANESDSRQYQSLLLGGYYHLIDNLRLGLFYQRQYGVRHDEDWQKDPINGWLWVNSRQRGEDLAIFDLSPKFQVSFLPGKTWTFEFKTRYEYNFFDQDQNIRLRQNLTYFWLRDEQPWWSFFAQAEQVFPLNYGFTPVNESWIYLGTLYQQSPSFQIGFFAAQKWQIWGTSPQFLAQTGGTYSVSANSTVFGVLLIYRFADSEASKSE